MIETENHSDNPTPYTHDSKGRMYATGKRKTSIARVWIAPGSGKFVVNDKEKDAYFPMPSLQMSIEQVFNAIGVSHDYDVWCTVKGGGLSGQSDAVRHGLSVALQRHNPEFRAALKSEGFLTRDSRKVERKKPGLRKARRRPQFSKR